MTDREKWINDYYIGMEELHKKWQDSIDENNIYTNKDNDKLKVLVWDGIPHPNEWFHQDIRPLFVLKEAYNKEDDYESWDEVKWFLTNNENGSGNKQSGKIDIHTWPTLCRWAGYIFTKNEKVFDPAYETNWDNKYLHQIALINIKKYGGQCPSVDKDLRVHAKEYAEELFHQINLIKPTLIICGYTGWLLDIVWREKTGHYIRNRAQNLRVYDVKGLDYPARLMDFWHPSAWSASVDLTKAFINDVNIAFSDELPNKIQEDNIFRN